MAPNRRSVPTSLSLSDSSDPESWGSTTINNNSTVGKVKSPIASGMVTNCEINGSTNGHLNGSSTEHYVNAKMFNYNHLTNSNHINRIQININSSSKCVDNEKINSCVNISSSTQPTSLSSSTTITTSTTSSVNHNHQNNNNNNHQYPWKNWPKIDLISSIDPFESSDSMISAFACVAHVINNDSANEEDPIDGDNEIIGIAGENSVHGNDDDDDGSYDSSNHPNSLESPENYRPIQKPQSLAFKSNNNNINSKLNGKFSSNDKYINRTDQVNNIKPSPPPLSTIPRPSQQPPPPPVSSSSSTLVSTPTSLIPNQISSPTSTVPQNCSSVITPITAKNHLYETIYPSNIRLTRDSKYFVDYQNYRSILSQPVEPVVPSLDSSVGHLSIKVNQTNPPSNHNQSTSIDLINSKDIKDMVRRSNFSSSATTSKKTNKNVTVGRFTTSSTVNQSYNQPKSIHNQTQSKPQAYNYHHPHHQHHLPGHSNSSSLYKPSLSPSSSSLRSPPPPSSPSPQLNQGDHNQRLMKKSTENSPTYINNHHLTSKSSNNQTAISRPTQLQFNKRSNNSSHDEIDGRVNNNKSSTIENVINNNDLSSTQISTTEKNRNPIYQSQQTQKNKLKPDQVYPNSISIPVISRANVRSTEEYATVNKSRSIHSIKSATLASSSPIKSFNDEIKLLSKDDSLLSSKGGGSIESPMSLTSLSSSSPTNSPSTSSIGNNLLETKHKPSKSKSKDKSSASPVSQTTSSSSSRSFLSKFFSLTHVISRTFSVEKIDKHRSSNDHSKGTLIKSAVSTPALSLSTRSSLFNDLNGNNQANNQFTSTRTLIDSPTGNGGNNNQENIEPVSLTSSTSGSKSLQTKSSSSFVRAFKNRLSLRRSKRKVKVKVDVTRTKSDPRSKGNRYEDDKMIPKQPMKEETIYGSIVAVSGDMKIVEIHRPQGKPFGFFVARGTVNNVKGIFISRIDSNGEKAYQGLLEIGDRLIEIDGNDVTEASVIQVNQLMSNKTKLTLKIIPFSAIADVSKA